MNFPKTIETYCVKCNAHTEHKLKEFKPAAYSRPFARRHSRSIERRKKKGYGAKVPRPPSHKKQGKRFVASATCGKCGKKHYFKSLTRMKKVTLGQAAAAQAA
ncbi:MAG TPA: 50S ribosomal protein L44e [archaeon]|nr:50S ribosomal protein L44e [archaeon]